MIWMRHQSWTEDHGKTYGCVIVRKCQRNNGVNVLSGVIRFLPDLICGQKELWRAYISQSVVATTMTMTAVLTASRPLFTRNCLPKPLHLSHIRSIHNGTAASRTVAALASLPPPSSASMSTEPNTHFRVTLRRSGISLGKRIQGTLAALGLRRRMQTVYHAHTPETAGMILAVKELVEVENVPARAVRTAGQQRAERKSARGFVVVGSRVESRLLVA